MKAYNQDLRARAIKLFDDGYERKHIKSILSISYDTLNRAIALKSACKYEIIYI
jgi:transposase